MFNSKNKDVKIVEVDEQYDNTRLDRFVRATIGPINQSALEKLLRQKRILINHQKAISSQRVKKNQVVSYENQIFLSNTKKKKIFSNKEVIFYKNLYDKIIVNNSKNFIIINKPNNISVQGGTNQKFHLDNFLKVNFGYQKETPKLVHRLDKDTSGLLLVAKNLVTARYFTKLFKDGKIIKIYFALVSPCPIKNEGRISVNIDKRKTVSENKMFVSDKTGKKSLTKYVVLDKVSNEIALVALYPVTGRTHQLRLHMNYLGSPIIGDKKYFDKSFDRKNINYDNLKLHAAILKVPKENIFYADIPDHFKETLDSFGLKMNNLKNQNNLFDEIQK